MDSAFKSSCYYVTVEPSYLRNIESGDEPNLSLRSKTQLNGCRMLKGVPHIDARYECHETKPQRKGKTRHEIRLAPIKEYKIEADSHGTLVWNNGRIAWSKFGGSTCERGSE